jgi:hypothetical protein
MLEEKETGWPELLQKQGLTFKAGGTVLEGQTYEFMTGHDTRVSMGDDLKEWLPWVRYGARGGVEGNGGTNDKSMWEGQIRGRAAPFLLTNPDFSKTEMVNAYVHTVVAPAIDYWKRTIQVKKGTQVERMKRVCIFNPLHVLTNKIWVSDIEGLKIFKLSQHPRMMVQIEVMKNEVITYQTPADSIKPLVERKDDKGQDAFDISDWWKESSIQLSIRSRLTLTTYSYQYSLSLTIEHSSSRVSRAEGEREEWVRGFSRLLASAIIHCHVHAGPLVVRGICQTKNHVLLWIIAFFSQ